MQEDETGAAMPKCRGTPFVKGVSGNPNGRPRGSHNHWNGRRYRFAVILYSFETQGNRAAAARLAGYSPRSARFTASRIIRTPEVRRYIEKLKKLGEVYGRVLVTNPELSKDEAMALASRIVDNPQHS